MQLHFYEDIFASGVLKSVSNNRKRGFAEASAYKTQDELYWSMLNNTFFFNL